MGGATGPGIQSKKQKLDDLALFGGAPTFCEPVCVGNPAPADEQRFIELTQEALRRGRLSNNGPLVQNLERSVERLLDVSHCIAVSNATAGLQVLARALELKGEVLMPAWTFRGTAYAMSWLGLYPRFCDVDPTTHHLDAQHVEQTISRATSAVLAVHLWGRPCDINRLEEVCERHRVPLMIDAAQAFGASHHVHRVGRFGAAEVFSLHATKIIHGFEGGLITTEDAELARRCRELREFGSVGGMGGTNAKLSEVAAAMALTFLPSLDGIIERKRSELRMYAESLKAAPSVRLVTTGTSGANGHYLVLEALPSSPLERASWLELLTAENVVATTYFEPGCHRLPGMGGSEPLPVTEDLARRVICLPHGGLSPGAVKAVHELVTFIAGAAPDVAAAMAKRPAHTSCDRAVAERA